MVRAASLLIGLVLAWPADAADQLSLMRRPSDPYGCPRPGPGDEHVPVRTSFYVEIGVPKAGRENGGPPDGSEELPDRVLPESVTLELAPAGGESLQLLRRNGEFAPGYRGRFFPGKQDAKHSVLAVYIEGDHALHPATKYTVRVSARSQAGRELPAEQRAWSFTTEAPARRHPLDFELSLREEPVRWKGGFFTGFCGVSFCTNRQNRIPTFELMQAVREQAPKAWSLQRDFWLTGMEHRPELFSPQLPNIVRELQTRRITALADEGAGTRLTLEDFFGHRQYGIESGRALSGDYRPGDEVLIADGVNSARAVVRAVDDDKRTLLVTRVEAPAGGWLLEYAGPLPENEDPDAPGLFPPGGCYLRKFRPAGTPRYYWGRLDREWDLTVGTYGRRVVVNFADAPGDLSIDGRNATTAKDYVELHTAVYAITSHIIERYGERSLEFVWSIFNEPDLGALFWRADWIELQKFYDYSVDAILRAFEDHGYDSRRVFVGGLELGGIFGVHLRLKEFLVHCSPTAPPVKDALLHNAAFADSRLDGKRSRRVEALCRAHAGRGSPCDFVSIHAYNTSRLMAEKLARAKEMALETDAAFFADLWVNSHESVPGWDLPPDPAFSDSYLGNGYFPTWCADVTRRRLARAALDPRYAAGETILTFWPWPSPNFEGRNDCVRAIHVDDDGDGTGDRVVTVAMPILHFLGLLNRMGDRYHLLPEETVGGHVVSGFTSPTAAGLAVLLYTHHALDTQSRSEQSFRLSLDVSGLPAGTYGVRQYCFDKQNNSYFHLARALRARVEEAQPPLTAESAKLLQAALDRLRSGSVDERLAALEDIGALGRAAKSAMPAIYMSLQGTPEPALRSAALKTIQRINAPAAYPADEVRRVEQLAALRETHRSSLEVDGQCRLTLDLSANGACMVFVERAEEGPADAGPR